MHLQMTILQLLAITLSRDEHLELMQFTESWSTSSNHDSKSCLQEKSLFWLDNMFSLDLCAQGPGQYCLPECQKYGNKLNCNIFHI